MQSKISSFNKTIFKKNLGRTWAIGAVLFVLLTVFYPVALAINTTHSMFVENGRIDAVTANYNLLSVYGDTWFPVVIHFFAIAASVLTFWYLYQKRDINMIHTFPVSRLTLYKSGVLSSFCVLAVPVLANAIVTTIVAIFCGATALGVIWQMAFIQLGEIVFYLGFALFCMMLTGQAITALIFYYILNFVYIGMEITFRLLSSSLNFGMNNAMNEISINPMTPIMYMCNQYVSYTPTYDPVSGVMTSITYKINGVPGLCGYVVAGLLFVFIAYILYKKKHLETVHDFISVNWVKPIFIIGMSFFVSAVFAILTGTSLQYIVRGGHNTLVAITLVSAIIYGVIIFFITEMLINKSVRVFNKKNLRLCGIYSACALFVLIAVVIDIVGVTKKVPDASKIEWAGVSGPYTFVFDTPEEVEKALEAHRAIIADAKEIQEMNGDWYSDYGSGTNFTFKYKLTNGKVMSRQYFLVNPEGISASDNYKKVMDKVYGCVDNPETIKNHLIGEGYDKCEVTYATFQNYFINEDSKEVEMMDTTVENLPADEKARAYREVYEAVLKDIDAGALFTSRKDQWSEDRLYNDLVIELKLTEGGWKSDDDRFYGWNYETSPYQRQFTNLYVTLNEDCTNTIEVLYKYGFCLGEEYIWTYGEYNDYYAKLYSDF